MAVYAYLRVSTGKQDGENQKHGVDELADRLGLEITEYIDDEGVSGTKEPEKRELGRLLEKLKPGDVLLADKIPEQVDESGHTDLGTIESIIRNIGKKSGVENCHPHRFRRTGATMALRGGMPLIQVSKILGHEQITTTQIYLDVSDEELMQAHKKYAI